MKTDFFLFRRRMPQLLLSIIACVLAVPAFAKQVELLVDRSKTTHRLQVSNHLDTPVTVILTLDKLKNSTNDRLTMIRQVIPAQKTVSLVTLKKQNPAQPLSYRHSFSYAINYGPARGNKKIASRGTTRYKRITPAPTAYNKQNSTRYLYERPWSGSFRLTQGPNGKYSHTTPKSRYAVDIAMPQGTPILAARDGVVVGTNTSQKGRYPNPSGNFVRIRHADGSHAVYLHLQPHSVRVRPGQQVHAGTPIARSGNTGRSTGPHLHFVVQKKIGGNMRSIPFQFRQPVAALPNFASNP